MPTVSVTRKVSEEIVVDGPCVIRFDSIQSGNRAQISVTADRSVKILRRELVGRTPNGPHKKPSGETTDHV